MTERRWVYGQVITKDCPLNHFELRLFWDGRYQSEGTYSFYDLPQTEVYTLILIESPIKIVKLPLKPMQLTEHQYLKFTVPLCLGKSLFFKKNSEPDIISFHTSFHQEVIRPLACHPSQHVQSNSSPLHTSQLKHNPFKSADLQPHLPKYIYVGIFS